MSLITSDSFVTAESIAEKVKSGEWSAVEILDKYLSQIGGSIPQRIYRRKPYNHP